MLLRKGIEIEQFAGYDSGIVLPLSRIISDNLDGFSYEPDQRNFEYVTEPTQCYNNLLCQLLRKRQELRNFLRQQSSDWTIIPGSTMSRPFDKEFHFSDPDYPFHRYIRDHYGVDVITASAHYNIGMDDPEEIVRLCDLLRSEVSLALAMTASSPFYDGKATGAQSFRWLSFPKVPEFPPIFGSLDSYRRWNLEMIDSGQFFNARHFWVSVRPNGPDKPHLIDRIEVRICDLSTSWELTCAVMAWLELRVQMLLSEQALRVPPQDRELPEIFVQNEQAAASFGLGGHFVDWLHEEETSHFEAIERRLHEGEGLAHRLGISQWLQPIRDVLAEGNEATRKMDIYAQGQSIEQVMRDWIDECERVDARTYAHCQKLAASTGNQQSL